MIQVDVLLHGVGYALDPLFELEIRIERQPEVARRHLQLRQPRQAAEARHTDVGTRLAEVSGMRRRGDQIKDHAGHLDTRIEVRKAVDESRRGVGRRTGIDDKHDRQAERPRHLRRASARLVEAVKEPHHALGHARIGRPAVFAIYILYMIGRRHPSVEVHGRQARGPGVIACVDIVRPTFERLHGESASPECAQ